MRNFEQIKDYITNRFANMTQNEFEDLAFGAGTLSILDDECVAKFGLDLSAISETECEQLYKHCQTQSNLAFNRFYEQEDDE
jgi:hypothetical protein